MLVETATAEESQARARRSAFRTIELLGELQDNSLLRKYLSAPSRSNLLSSRTAAPHLPDDRRVQRGVGPGACGAHRSG